jgi:N-acyl-D-amino-acid deacylase
VVAVASDRSINLDGPRRTAPDAVRKTTDMPASILGLTDRGLLKPGYAADVAVFDPATVGKTHSFERPKSYARGVPDVLVNGVVVIDKGEHTGARPGKPVRGRGAQKARSADVVIY